MFYEETHANSTFPVQALSEVFRKARMGAPAIVFIDEIEALVSTRFGCKGGGGSGVQERVLSVLLNEMDGIGVKVDMGESDKVGTSTIF